MEPELERSIVEILSCAIAVVLLGFALSMVIDEIKDYLVERLEEKRMRLLGLKRRNATMKLDELLPLIDDETWIMLVEPGGKPHFIWAADYIGGWKQTLEELKPLRQLEIGDSMRVEIHDDPDFVAKEVPMLCIDLVRPATQDGHGKQEKRNKVKL